MEPVVEAPRQHLLPRRRAAQHRRRCLLKERLPRARRLHFFIVRHRQRQQHRHLVRPPGHRPCRRLLRDPRRRRAAALQERRDLHRLRRGIRLHAHDLELGMHLRLRRIRRRPLREHRQQSRRSFLRQHRRLHRPAMHRQRSIPEHLSQRRPRRSRRPAGELRRRQLFTLRRVRMPRMFPRQRHLLELPGNLLRQRLRSPSLRITRRVRLRQVIIQQTLRARDLFNRRRQQRHLRRTAQRRGPHGGSGQEEGESKKHGRRRKRAERR